MTRPNEPIGTAFLDGDNASYDDIAKRFLAHKLLLAQILKEVVEEFKDCPLRDIAEKYIEGEPAVNISEIPLDPDLTNAAKPGHQDWRNDLFIIIRRHLYPTLVRTRWPYFLSDNRPFI